MAGSDNDGSHTWHFMHNGGGAPLATGTIDDGPIVTTATWRTIPFDLGATVTITPGTTYVAAVFMANGIYDWTIADPGTFNAPIVNGELTGLMTNPPGNANGVFDYGATLTFPTSSFTLGENYWVDPVFAATPYGNNNVVFNGSTIKVYNNTDLKINTVVHLNGSVLQMGIDGTSTQNLLINDQVFLMELLLYYLANATTVIDANNASSPATR